MEYKLFDEYITLQALLKELSIIHSGGAIKGFLANNTVLFNGEDAVSYTHLTLPTICSV